jgi:predicted regulator of Ras-like GTPase activity (Roadblock/LC7/MglB family)
MAGLRDVVQHLADRDGVDAVVVVSGDGLPIDHATRSGLDPEALAAMIPALAQTAGQVGAAAEGGDLSNAVFEFGGRLLVLTALKDGNSLLVLTGADTNIGSLLYDLKKHRPAIAELL